MTIRNNFTLLLALMGLLVLGGSLWESREIVAKRDLVGWVQLSNQLSDISLRASAVMAMERGITATIIANPADADAEMTDEMERLRRLGDSHFESLQDLAAGLINGDPAHPMPWGLRHTIAHRETVVVARGQVDLLLAGEPSDITERYWIGLATSYIEAMADLRAAAAQPLHDNIYSHGYNPLFKETLFSISEHAGRERATIGAAIAQGRSLNDFERDLMLRSRHIVENSIARVRTLAGFLSSTPELERALATLDTGFLGRYEDLRRAVYRAEREGFPYPVGPREWYDEATAGIDTVLALSEVVSRSFERDIDRLRKNADIATFLVIISIFAAANLFIFAAWAIRRRILEPLRRLEEAMETVTGGDLTRPLPPFRDDEIGILANAFEKMRRNLLEDIEQRLAAEAEARMLSQAIEHSVGSVVITDPEGIIEYVNPQFTTTTGYEQDEVMGRKINMLRSGYTPQERYEDLWQTIKDGRMWEGEILDRRKNGELYWCLQSISPVRDSDGTITNFVGIQHDINDRKEMEEQIDFLAWYDKLTRLPNRSLLAKRFDKAAAAADKSGVGIALISLGISRFRLINDSLGHAIGDEVLRTISERLTRCAREHDTVARYSGDEFVVLVADFHNTEDVSAVARRMIDSVSRPIQIEGHDLRIHMHGGISVMPDDGNNMETLLRNADTAQHMAAHEGRNTFRFYTDDMNAAASERLALEQDLRRALEQNVLELHYQPKVDLNTGEVVGCEALARWRHPVEGDISPVRFIPVAEETGLIMHLGQWALREACRQNQAWQKEGLPSMIMAVNLSALQLQQPDLTESIAAILKETGMDPGLLELELTESAVMDNPEEMIAILDRIKSLGVRLAVDDFGTGYSSLAYLRRFPFDTLKIDRSFITNITTDPDEASIAQTIIAMGHSLRMQIVAEGVETTAQAAYLHHRKCDQLQGYLFSRPLPAAGMATLLREGRRLTLAEDDNDPAEAILLVSDDDEQLDSLKDALAGNGYLLFTAADSAAACELLALHNIGMVISDMRLRDMAGIEFMTRVWDLYPEVARIIVTTSDGAAAAAISEGVVDGSVRRPWERGALRALVKATIVRGGRTPDGPAGDG